MPRFEEIPRVHIIEREEMPMNKTKKTLRKILAVVLSLSMMLSMTAISPKKADAFMKADVTEIKSSDMSELLSHYWNYKLEDNKLTINITRLRKMSKQRLPAVQLKHIIRQVWICT